MMARRVIAGRGGFSPKALFAAGEQGVWYDPSDLTTLYQDAAGTTPVTAMEQPVGLMLDKSGKSPTTWLQKISDPTLSTTTGWSNPAAFSAGKYISGNSSYSPTATIGKLYRYTYTVSTASAGGLAIYICGVQKGTSSPIPAGTYSGTVVAISTKVFEFYDPSWGWTGQIDSVSVEELQGNHAFQTTSANRPVLSARVNLLTKTERFDDAVWVKTGFLAFDSGSVANTTATLDPNGKNTADLLVENSATSYHDVVSGDIAGLAGTAYTLSRYVKAGAGSRWIVLVLFESLSNQICYGHFQPSTNTVGIIGSAGAQWTSVSFTRTDVGNGWYRLVLTATLTSAANISDRSRFKTTDGGVSSYAGDGTSSMYWWGASLVPANQASLPYQRVNTATDYDTVGFPLYLRFNGSNSAMQTNSVDFTGTDKMTAFAGVRKLSDTARGIIVELNDASVGTNKYFCMDAPSTIAFTGATSPYANFNTQVHGSVNQKDGDYATFCTTNVFAAPTTNVLTSEIDIALKNTNSAKLRVNGIVPVKATTTFTGTNMSGNLPNASLYIGARGGSSRYFNGHLYSLIVRGAQTPANLIAATERYVARKTGVTL